MNPEQCRTCGGKGRVIESRITPTCRRRRRECPDCGRRWTSYESFINPRRVLFRDRPLGGAPAATTR